MEHNIKSRFERVDARQASKDMSFMGNPEQNPLEMGLSEQDVSLLGLSEQKHAEFIQNFQKKAAANLNRTLF